MFFFNSKYGFIFLQELFWEHLHEEYNTVILQKY